MAPFGGLFGGSILVAVPGFLSFGEGFTIHILTLFALLTGCIVLGSFFLSRLIWLCFYR